MMKQKFEAFKIFKHWTILINLFDSELDFFNNGCKKNSTEVCYVRFVTRFLDLPDITFQISVHLEAQGEVRACRGEG